MPRSLKKGPFVDDHLLKKVDVLNESGDGEQSWGTVGVSENIIEASWEALVDSMEYKLFSVEEQHRKSGRRKKK